MNNFLLILIVFRVLSGSYVTYDHFESIKNRKFQINSGCASEESEEMEREAPKVDPEYPGQYGSCWYCTEKIGNEWRGLIKIEGILRLSVEMFSTKEETESVLEKFFQTLQQNKAIGDPNAKLASCGKKKAKKNDLVPRCGENKSLNFLDRAEQNGKESIHSANARKKAIQIKRKIELKSKTNYLLQLQNLEKNVYRWWILKKDKNSAVAAIRKNPLTTFLLVKVTSIWNLVDGDTVIPLNAQCAKKQKRKESVTLARVIEKNEESFVVLYLHGEKNGREEKIDRKDVHEVMRVDYNFSEAEISKYAKELETHVKTIPTMEASIEDELFNLCFKDPLEPSCAQSIHNWKLLQLKKHDYICSTLIWNAKLFHARRWLDEIECFLRTLKLKRKRPDSIELEQQDFSQSGYFRLQHLEILWLGIKAQSFNSAFAKLASEYAEEAYKTRDKGNLKFYLGKLQKLYKNGVGAKFEKDSKSRVLAFGLYKMTKSASKLLEKTYNKKKQFDFESGGTADNFSSVLNFDKTEMNQIYSNVKKYVKALEKNEMKFDKVNIGKSKVGGQGVFPIETIQKYETIGIWRGELYGEDEENVFKSGGEKSNRNLYAIDLNEGKSSFILDPDPESYHSFPNDCRSAKNFHSAIGALTKAEKERFNLGWLQFSYQGVPYMANVALKRIDAEHSKNELFTYYGGNYVMNTLEKNKNDKKNRLEIIKNARQNVIELLEKM